MPRRSSPVPVFVVCAALMLAGCYSGSSDEPRALREDVRLLAEATTIQAVVPRNATFESLLRQQELAPELASAVVSAVRNVFNPRELRANQQYWVVKTLDGLFREFRYQINTDELLRIVFREDADGSTTVPFDVERVTLPKEFVRSTVTAEITPEANSLIAAFTRGRENRMLPIRLAEIFSGEVDFNTDLRQGDTFTVLFDRAVRNGEFIGYGGIHAAVIEVDGRRLTAFRFPDADGKDAWYDEDGQSLRRQFLKTPLPFDPRITSGFSYNRLHPVHGTRRPHLGVDYGAPTGTRVLAVADGVVVRAGWAGEAGRLVHLRHSGGYETMYLHLSGFGPGIRPGVRVAQGDVIGYVGMTGTATGPHLDYRVRKNGTYVNPVTAFANMPAGEPIAAERMDDFIRFRDEALRQMREPASVPVLMASAD